MEGERSSKIFKKIILSIPPSNPEILVRLPEKSKRAIRDGSLLMAMG
jgi:hypothetical protein